MNFLYWRPINLILSLILLGVGLWLTATFNPRIQSEPLAIHLDSQKQLVARIYTPKTGNSPDPVMVLCHGVNSSKEVMAPLAVEFARNGIAAITFDFGGYGESYPLPLAAKSEEKLAISTLNDAQAVVNFAFSHPEKFDPTRVGIGGHSLGGTVAQQIAQQDKRLRTVLVLSMTPETALPKKADFWFGVGAYEQLNTAAEIRAALGDNPAELVVSPTADHITAPYDPFLIQAAVKWAMVKETGFLKPRVFYLDEQSPQETRFLEVSFILILGLMMTFAGGIASGTCLLLRLRERLRSPISSANLGEKCNKFIAMA
ncbi:alpha/beta hydrolase [[Phormidium] sp. ETS-05]|uniref:alpha/beta hydrolase n=1 Tax=[Phormidium] sp. ETS-05 TaxID=222819 RepID=UPI0018EEF614|nr:alpha/beta fold hydrolase [[Phormidium] sp. ETS-05]